ncbi:site-specific DNA-methyltransferase [Listeria innocua]|uniref:site-specific DNA-methyltransferase n=1 Tax=Listeria innocua TaxID=1642 RepID=UPI00158932F9|nr:site-specific DNA-methyltransferase [Listeria innocua]EII7091572.1 site-specific DNA-methyltransferase [Listeria innocua]EII7488261.1 site-specific DNA-methyltransferase [Listeria innocua]EIQ2575339.1 site-specific DNA-methyltransferase [Listeria innocua]EKE9625244.1 site-specific DNA-methyltransferase [Listeria innocua]EKE9679564.1 site-specific DNA-methyltransferase [Listeria innocua]
MMTNLQQEIKNVLENLPSYWENGVLLKNRIIEDVRNYQPELLAALLKNETIQKAYSLEVNGLHIFKVEDFVSMMRYKNYLESSYTKYSNEVGLTSAGKYLKYTSDVVLDFPHKDGILEGGMTQEDRGKEEVYYHNILAKEEIDTLLSPKVFKNIQKYDESGSFKTNQICFEDNLIIKGNNLIALHTLKKRYAKKVKLIYLDPPYNTGKDGFKYNDRFNHSSWLVFMKNRLEIAKDFLRDDGLIMMSIDDNQQAELKILCNEIFGSQNFLANLVWNLKTGTQAGHFTRSHEYILVFAKNKSLLPNFSGGEGFIEHSALKRIGQKNPASDFTFLKGTRFDADDGTELTGTWGTSEKTTLKQGRMKAKNGKLMEDVTLEAGWAMKTQMTSWFDGRETYDTKGQKVLEFYFNSNGILRYKKERGIINPKTVIDDVGSTKGGTSHLEELIENNSFSFPKNERLIERLISITTSEGDLVMDFFMGTGTTAAVSHKLKRKYIGIEQMNYINDVSVPRLQKVIIGEQGGISKDVKWTGGGSFIYAELFELNQVYINELQQTSNTEEIEAFIRKIKASPFLNIQFDLEKFISKKKGSVAKFSKKSILV